MENKQYKDMIDRTGYAYAAVCILESYRPAVQDAAERRRVDDRLQYERGFLAGMEKAAGIMGADMNRWMTDTFRAELSCWPEAFQTEAADMYVDLIRPTRRAVSDRMAALTEIMAGKEEAAG